MIKKYLGYDILKFVLSICIIFLHINPFPRESIFYFISMAIGSLGVPCFFILSGFFFFSKIYDMPKEEHKKIYLNYLKRLLCLLGFWLIVYFIAYDIWYIIDGNVLTNIWEYIKRILFGGKSFFLWYVVSLIVGISLTYFLHKVMKEYVAILSFVLFIIGALCLSYNFLIKDTFLATAYKWYKTYFVSTRNGLFFAFPCVCLGMLVAKGRNYLDTHKNFAIIFFISSLSLFIIEFILIKTQLNIIFSQMHFSAILLSLGLVLICYYVRGETKFSIFARKLSFLIYVIHPVILKIINALLTTNLCVRFGLDYYWYLLWPIQIPVIAGLSILLGWLLIRLSDKIKFLKKVM